MSQVGTSNVAQYVGENSEWGIFGSVRKPSILKWSVILYTSNVGNIFKSFERTDQKLLNWKAASTSKVGITKISRV